MKFKKHIDTAESKLAQELAVLGKHHLIHNAPFNFHRKLWQPRTQQHCFLEPWKQNLIITTTKYTGMQAHLESNHR